MSELTLREKLTNINIIEDSVIRFNSGDIDTIKFRCWDKDEVKFIKNYMEKKYPEIPIIFSWLV